MNSPTNEPAVKLNGAPDRIAGLSDVFVSRNFASIRSSEGLHRELLEKIPALPNSPKVDETFVGYCNVFDWVYEFVDGVDRAGGTICNDRQVIAPCSWGSGGALSPPVGPGQGPGGGPGGKAPGKLWKYCIYSTKNGQNTSAFLPFTGSLFS